VVINQVRCAAQVVSNCWRTGTRRRQP
jgi:hypothetical protein